MTKLPMPSLFATLAVALLLPCAPALTGSALAPSTNEAGPVLVLRAGASGTPFFFSAAAIAELESRSRHQVAEALELSASNLEKLSSAVSAHLEGEAFRRSKRTDPSPPPCLRPIPGQFRERKTTLRTVEESASGQRLPLPTLVLRARHAVLGEVVEVVPGLLSGAPSSMVRVRVLERLSPEPGSLGPGSEFSYMSDFYDFELRGERVCGLNEDFFEPGRGKRALFLLPDGDPSLKIYDSFAELELIGDELILGSYRLLERDTGRFALPRLRKEIQR